MLVSDEKGSAVQCGTLTCTVVVVVGVLTYCVQLDFCELVGWGVG